MVTLGQISEFRNGIRHVIRRCGALRPVARAVPEIATSDRPAHNDRLFAIAHGPAGPVGPAKVVPVVMPCCFIFCLVPVTQEIDGRDDAVCIRQTPAFPRFDGIQRWTCRRCAIAGDSAAVADNQGSPAGVGVGPSLRRREDELSS